MGQGRRAQATEPAARPPDRGGRLRILYNIRHGRQTGICLSGSACLSLPGWLLPAFRQHAESAEKGWRKRSCTACQTRTPCRQMPAGTPQALQQNGRGLPSSTRQAANPAVPPAYPAEPWRLTDARSSLETLQTPSASAGTWPQPSRTKQISIPFRKGFEGVAVVPYTLFC